VHFGYDALNRRYLQTVENGSGTILSTVYYVNQGFRKDRGDAGDEIALRLDGTGAVISRYLHGSLVDEVLAEENIGSGGVRDVLWAMTDHQGSVRDLARVTSGTASVVNHIVYDAFGKTVSETDAAIAHLYGYTGRELDKETGLQYNRARYLDLVLARFISQDPKSFAAGDTNLYRYVGNHPSYATDPSGLMDPLPDGPWFDGPDGNPIPRPVADGSGWVRGPANHPTRPGPWVQYKSFRIDLEPFARKLPGFGTTTVAISPTGTSDGDIAYMNKMFKDVVDENGLSVHGNGKNGWTWHHAGFDRETGMMHMQLVPSSLNNDRILIHKGGTAEFLDYAGEVLSDVEKAKKVAAENPALATAISNALEDSKTGKTLSNRVKKGLLAKIGMSSAADDIISEAADNFKKAIAELGSDATVVIAKYKTKAGLLRASVKIGGKALTAITVWQVASYAAAGEYEKAGKAAVPIPAEEILSITVLPLGQFISDSVRFGDPEHHKDWARRMGIDPEGLTWDKSK